MTGPPPRPTRANATSCAGGRPQLAREPEVAARAFDPFSTTKPIGLGTGLGLSMVYGLVRQSGGQAQIASAIGGGTTVRLYSRATGARHGVPRPAPRRSACCARTSASTCWPPTGASDRDERQGGWPEAARERRPGLPFLLVTGYAENAALDHGDLEPGLSIVTKPFALDDRGRRVGAILSDR